VRALLSILGGLSIAAWFALAGCGSVRSGEEGAEGGACRADGTCDPVLECINGTCAALACASVEDCPASESSCERAACDDSACRMIPENDGLPCPRAGTICAEGSCVPGCFIEGVLYGADAVNPESACLVCDPFTNRTDWTEKCDPPIECAEGGACTLTVEKTGDGAGTVASDPGGLSCGETCSASFDFDEVVTLIQTTTSGEFIGWSGPCFGTGNCSVTMTEARTVQAQFSQVHNASVSTFGHGTVFGPGIECSEFGGQCDASYPSGAEVSFEAVPDFGEDFLVWDGVCSSFGGNPTCVVTVEGPIFVQARFSCNGGGGNPPQPECQIF
jgi:hypothetical protein